MNYCVVCGRELLTGLDEYGASASPLCRNCFFDQDHDTLFNPDIEEAVARAIIEDCEREIGALHNEKQTAEGYALEEICLDITDAERRKNAAEVLARKAQNVRGSRIAAERARLAAWVGKEAG